MSSPLKLGIIGYGFSVKVFHLPMILGVPDLQVHSFFQRAAAPSSGKPGEHCTVDYPQAKHYQNADDFFNDVEIDVVLVATKTDSHFEYGRRALQSGKHCVIEKPFTRSTQEANELVKLAKQQGKILTVYQNRRFDGDYITLKSLIEKKALGNIVEFESHFDHDSWGAPKAWEGATTFIPGTGTVLGLGVHTMDQVVQIFGLPSIVTAILRSHRPGAENNPIEDFFTILFQYGGDLSGLVVTLKSTDVSVVTKQPRFFVRGRQGTYLKNGMDVQEAQLVSKPQMSVKDARFGVEDAADNGVLTTRTLFDGVFQTKDEASGFFVGRVPGVPGNYTLFYENLVKAVRGEEEIAVKPEEARDVIRLSELVRESAETGRSVAWS